MKTKNTIWLYSIFILGIFLIISGSCKKDESDELTKTVTDFDGNVYHQVKIGDQVWLVENLKVTHYNNGDLVEMVSDSAAWVNLTSSAYCNYDNDVVNSDTYGRLYNWYAVNDSRKIAPQGWHIPSDSEWATLINYLGGDSIAGGKMKEAGTSHWISPNTGATNESGFTALPGGYKSDSFVYLKVSGFFWSSTGNTNAQILRLQNSNTSATIDTKVKTNALSVRCLKD